MLAPTLRFAVLALLAGASACSYSPHPKDGVQECYQGRCADGYVCADGKYCYSAGHLPTPPGTGGAVGIGGALRGTGGAVGVGGVTVGAGGGNGGAGMVGTGGAVVAGTGGVSGTGGATTCQPTRATGSNPLIDNMADGDNAIIPQDGRAGGWYSYGDNTGTITLVSSNPGQMCAVGSGFTSWGAGMGVSLNADATKSCTYDASVYSGIRFTIQGSITNGMVRLGVQTADISTPASGGTCVSTSTTNNCDDVYGADLLPGASGGVDCSSKVMSWTCGPVSSSTTGNQLVVSIPFAYMSQQGWGRSFPKFDTTLTLALQWQFKTCTESTCYTAGTSFNICVGNVTFY
jgi:hypothetical protein